MKVIRSINIEEKLWKNYKNLQRKKIEVQVIYGNMEVVVII